MAQQEQHRMKNPQAEKLYAAGYNLLLKARLYWTEAERTWVDELDLKKWPLWRDPIFSDEVKKLLFQGDILAIEGNKLYDEADRLR